MLRVHTLLSTLFLLIFISAPLLADTEKRDVGSFERVSLGISGTLYLSQGPTTKVEITGDKGDLEKIETYVKNGRLIIKTKGYGWSWNNMGDVEIFVQSPNINGISVSGSGRIRAPKVIKSDEMEVDVSGSGKIHANIETKSMEIDISGSGSIELEGQSSDTEVSISGSGKLIALDHKASSYYISISGSGRCEVHAEEEIRAEISGSGKVRYKGDPERIRSNVSGSGSVQKM